MNIPAPTSSAGSAPEIEDGLYVVRFNKIYPKVHEDWAQEKDKFGKVDTGERYHFNATVLDDEYNPVMLADVKEDADDPTEEFELEALTRNMSSHEKANSYALLKGILTAGEFTLWLAGELTEEQGEKVSGRLLNAQVTHNSKGWPQIEAFLGPAKAKGK